MNWLQKISQSYLDIGHRDEEYAFGNDFFNKDINKIPDFVLWVFANGDLETSSVNPQDKGGGDSRHATWSPDSSQYYSGRYEPETGRLSVSKPISKHFYPIPSALLQLLREKLGFISKVYEF